eukprot:257593-Rhodomonas_salina.1
MLFTPKVDVGDAHKDVCDVYDGKLSHKKSVARVPPALRNTARTLLTLVHFSCLFTSSCFSCSSNPPPTLFESSPPTSGVARERGSEGGGCAGGAALAWRQQVAHFAPTVDFSAPTSVAVARASHRHRSARPRRHSLQQGRPSLRGRGQGGSCAGRRRSREATAVILLEDFPKSFVTVGPCCAVLGCQGAGGVGSCGLHEVLLLLSYALARLLSYACLRYFPMRLLRYCPMRVRCHGTDIAYALLQGCLPLR